MPPFSPWEWVGALNHVRFRAKPCTYVVQGEEIRIPCTPLSPLSLWERVGVREKRRYVSKILWF